MKNPEQLLPPNPVLIDRAILAMMNALRNVGWLTNIYGRAERKIKRENGKDKTYPAAYTGDEYLNMLPDASLGNYCWFDVPDYETFNRYFFHQRNRYKAPIRIIFFFDERTIFDYAISNKQKLKSDVLHTLSRLTSRYPFIVNRICERPENVFKGYNGYNEIQDQFTMYPYGIFAIEGEIWVDEECYDADGNVVEPCCCYNPAAK